MENNIEQLLRQAVSAGATDLHLKVGSAPVARIGGELERLDGYPDLTPADTQAYAEALFTSGAASDFRETGAADFAFGRQDVGRFRVTAFRQRGSVSVVLRRVMPGSRSFADLGLPRITEKLAQSGSGLLLVTGPSGSGKTTTVASILDWINANRAVSILTVEDPIEVLHPDKRSVVVQREVGVDTPSAAEAIRGALRHDTDVIVISEIDDADTARAAISAAETGRLVISSMRTNDPADTIHRIVAAFPEPQQNVVRGQLAAQLLAVVSQRLLDNQARGKTLACEVMTSNERVQEWIKGGAEPSVLLDIIKESEFFGMQTFDQSLLRLVLDKSVDLPSAIPYSRNVHEMRAKAMAAGIQI
ncbi:MAG: type IV pilus twitching motility protein PilT [Acidimicrobiia bacterium]